MNLVACNDLAELLAPVKLGQVIDTQTISDRKHDTFLGVDGKWVRIRDRKASVSVSQAAGGRNYC